MEQLSGAELEPGERPRWMLDANAFDYLLDRRIDLLRLKRSVDLFITNVQHVELLDVPDRRRRQRLLAVLSRLDPVVRPARANVWPESLRADTRHADWSNEVAEPDEPPPLNPALRDAKDQAIAEVAARERCRVVTDDRRFGQALRQAGLEVSGCADAFGPFLPTA